MNKGLLGITIGTAAILLILRWFKIFIYHDVYEVIVAYVIIWVSLMIAFTQGGSVITEQYKEKDRKK